MEQELAERVRAATEVLNRCIRDAREAGLVVTADAVSSTRLGGEVCEVIIVQVLKSLAASGNKAPMAVEL